MKRMTPTNRATRSRFRIQPGAAPGTVVHDPKSIPSVVRAVAYGPNGYEEEIINDIGDLSSLQAQWPFMWVHMQGLGDLPMLTAMQQAFGIHKLALEDMVNQNQRPKVEAYDDHNYLVAMYPQKDPELDFHQVNLILGSNYVLSFSDSAGDWDRLVLKRLREGRRGLLTLGPGYLIYALIDAVVDHYFPLIDVYTESLLTLERKALGTPGTDDLAALHSLSREFITLKRVLTPLLETLTQILRVNDPLIIDDTKIYFRDCYDHVSRLLDEIETNREISRSLVDTCLSTMSQRMNEVMKVLTIISTIFIPLGFIAGVYGMNFNTTVSPYNMPELGWVYGYPLALGLMAVIAVSLIIYFRAKGWLGQSSGG